MYKNSFFFNGNFVDKGLIYQAYDTVYHSHIESSYDFGYTAAQRIMPALLRLIQL